MMLEMLANANWERPIYMAITVGSENHLGMDNHFTQEGLAYRFTPDVYKRQGESRQDGKIPARKRSIDGILRFPAGHRRGDLHRTGIYAK